jgi:hypothetical protein
MSGANVSFVTIAHEWPTGTSAKVAQLAEMPEPMAIR